jgi:hypothetical protein
MAWTSQPAHSSANSDDRTAAATITQYATCVA